MSMAVVVTRDVEDRYRGFLASTMLEVSPGVYIGARLNKNCVEQIWSVLADWHGQLGRGSISMMWPDSTSSAGVQVRVLGSPPRVPVLVDGVLLMRRHGCS